MQPLKPLKLDNLATVTGGNRRTALMLEMASMSMNSTLMQLQNGPQSNNMNNMMMAWYLSSMMA
jgi:hypothetical protein